MLIECNRRRWAPVAAAVLAVLLAAGCQTAEKPTPRQEATRKWNAARASVLASLARDQYRTGNFDKCRQTVDDALRLTPEDPSLHLLSARLLIEKGQLEAAERELAVVRSAAPKEAEADHLSGVIYQRWQKPQAALDLYRVASEKAPAELAYLLAQVEMLVALDRPADALAMLGAKVDYFEHSGAIRDAVGQLLMQLGRHAEAVPVLRQAAILSDDDWGVRERLSLALYFSKDYRGAADALTALVTHEPYDHRADLFCILGECQLQASQPREARYSFETASQLDANSPAIWRGLGRAALEAGDLKRADLALTRAARLDPTLAETHLLLGYLRLRQDRLPEARASFERAGVLDPADATTLCMIGLTLEKACQPQDAAAFYAKALRIRPGDDLATQLMAGVDLAN